MTSTDIPLASLLNEMGISPDSPMLADTEITPIFSDWGIPLNRAARVRNAMLDNADSAKNYRRRARFFNLA